MIPRKLGFALLVLWVGVGALQPLAAASDIYDEKADAHRDIAAAISKAEAGNKNIILIFGANW